MEFYGERYVPTHLEHKISYEHWHRYLYACSLAKGKDVLDIACGEGYGAYHLSKVAKSVLGIDIDHPTIEHAQSTYQNSNLHFRSGSLLEPGIEESPQFDLITCFETIEHVSSNEQQAFLIKAVKMLRPNGILLISTPDKRVYSDVENVNNPYHQKEFQKEEFLTTLSSYFSHVVPMGQTVLKGSFISDHQSNSSFHEFFITSDNQQFSPIEDFDFLDTYIFCACSNSALQSIPSSLMFDPTNKEGIDNFMFSTLYLNFGEGYLEKDSIKDYNKLQKETSIFTVFNVSCAKDVYSLRFDPVEFACLLIIQEITIQHSAGKAIRWEASSNAGWQNENKYIFTTADPQIEISLKEPLSKGTTHFVKIEFIISDLYSFLVEELQDLKAQRDRVLEELDTANRKSQMLNKQKDKELEALLEYIDLSNKSLPSINSHLEALKSGVQTQMPLLQYIHNQIEAYKKEAPIKLLHEQLGALKTVLQSQHEPFQQIKEQLASLTAEMQEERAIRQEQIRNLQEENTLLKTQLRNASHEKEQLTEEQLELHKKNTDLQIQLEQKTQESQNILRSKKEVVQLNSDNEQKLVELGRNFYVLQQDQIQKTKYIDDLKNSLSFRLGWALTTPARYAFEFFRKKRSGNSIQIPIKHIPEKIKSVDPKIKFSIVTPVYKTPVDLLKACINSVLAQSYSNWELILVDDGSKDETLTQTLSEYKLRDSRIIVRQLPQNRGISGATNIGLEMSKGDYIALLDHDDLLTSDALDVMNHFIQVNDLPDILYSDQDKIDERGKWFAPFYKPTWSPEFFRGVMYIGHLLIFRKALLKEVAPMNKDFDGIQDYEFMLRLSEYTDRIVHVPKILYHWRVLKGSIAQDSGAKGPVDALQLKAVEQHLKRSGINGKPFPTGIPHRLQILPESLEKTPLVSVIIPTKNAPHLIGKCLESLFNITSYPNFEVIVIDNQTTDPEAIEILHKYPIRLIPYNRTFNFSEANNIGVRNAEGEYIILMNNDIEIIDPEWLQNMLFYGMQEDVGAVGALLLYPDRSVQHAGVTLGFRGTADHVMRYFPADSDGYYGSLVCAREVSAVTAACMLLPKELYKQSGGLNEYFKEIYQDVDLCCKIREKGFRIITTPTARLIHHESASRDAKKYNYIDRVLFLDLWEDIIEEGDPYYSINLDREYSKNKTGYTLS